MNPTGMSEITGNVPISVMLMNSAQGDHDLNIYVMNNHVCDR